MLTRYHMSRRINISWVAWTGDEKWVDHVLTKVKSDPDTYPLIGASQL